MQEQEREIKFSELLTGIAELYGKAPSAAVYEIWYNSLRRFDHEAISKAFSVHIQDPDTGKFMPKPADIIRIIEGSSVDSAYQAWTKVERAISVVGTYETVVFDDPIIHRVIQDMGGWIRLGQSREDELPFLANEFRRRYQGFKSQGEVPEYPSKLVGITEGENSASGFYDHIPEPKLIGDHTRAKQVLLAGSNRPSIQISSPGDDIKKLTVLPVNPNRKGTN